MSTGINMYARLFLGLRTRDNSGSFRCYRVAKLRQIDLNQVRCAAATHSSKRFSTGAVPSAASSARPRSSSRTDAPGIRKNQRQGGRQGNSDHLRAGRGPGLQDAQPPPPLNRRGRGGPPAGDGPGRSDPRSGHPRGPRRGRAFRRPGRGVLRPGVVRWPGRRPGPMPIPGESPRPRSGKSGPSTRRRTPFPPVR